MLCVMHLPLSRDLFTLPRDLTWVMHCAEGPVPIRAADAAHAFLTKELAPWTLGVEEWLKIPQRARAEAARLLGAEASQVTLTHSTSAALTILAQTLALGPGDEVMVPRGEFPSNAWPWRALESRGVLFREVPLWPGHTSGAACLNSTPPPVDVDPELRLLEALRPETKLLAVSWVRFQDGLTLDLPRLYDGCRGRGVILAVDGIQGAGTLPIDLSVTDAFATGVHKGLLAPQGHGLLWTSDALRAAMHPMGSWMSVADADLGSRPYTDLQREWLTDGRRFEQGGQHGLGLSALTESLRVLNEATVTAIRAHTHELTQALLQALRRTPAFEAEAARLLELFARGRIHHLVGLHHHGRGSAFLNALLETARA